MNDSGDQQQQRVGSSMNPKIASDSGYGSNKSTQRSSGSSKSHESSVSSESSTAYPPHPNASFSQSECQSHMVGSPSQGSSTKRQGKKKKSDRKLSVSEKVEVRLSAETTRDSNKSGSLSQSMDQSGCNMGNVGTICSGSQQQINQAQIMSPGSRASSSHDSKALQMAALTHALSCMKKFHKPTESKAIEEHEEMGTIQGNKWKEYFSTEFKNEDSCNENNFAAVVCSLDDGIVVWESISDILGFPKDMLVGRTLIDFVHPKDRMAFASHITGDMSFPMSEQQQQHSSQNQGPNANASIPGTARVKSEPFYCRLRQYRGLKTGGFGVVDKAVQYYPFKLNMTLKKVEPSRKDNNSDGVGTAVANNITTGAPAPASNSDESSRQFAGANANNPNSSVHLIIVANRIKSAYQFPDEICTNSGKFVTRHSASCHFGHMDSEAINYLGHLPQDLIGNSVLDYYHPDDMGLMKDIYEGVMQEKGKPFRSKPYRFRVYNGTFAMLETDWSCFINPWSWKLEFVIGQHRVIQGPGNPNVFMQPKEVAFKKTVTEKILDESKDSQTDIKNLLTETVTRHVSDPLRQQSSRRRKDMVAFVESFLEGMAKNENSEKAGSQCSGMFSSSLMERDSVMLGAISPHRDDQSGSNQSSETPPSYNQLNYKENIERFFQSHPKTERSNESQECSKMETNQSVHQSSDSNSNSSPNIDYSSGSNVRLSSCSGENDQENESGDRELCASPLTEERLSRHNKEMEKYMIQRHRALRVKSSMMPGSHKECRHRHTEKVYNPLPVSSSTSLSNDYGKCSYYIKLSRCQRRTKCKNKISAVACHGVKRMGNGSWDGDTHTAKHPHIEYRPARRNPILPPPATPGACCPVGHNAINLWPPFSISMTPGISTSTYRSAGTPVTSVPLMPMSSNIPGLVQSCYTNRPEGVPAATIQSGNRIPETISMSATTPAAPLLFLPSQHHQFVPQPDDDGHSRDWNVISEIVQLIPAGVVYQPLGPCIYGQSSPIMMPAGFLGTMIHPGSLSASVINKLDSSSAQTGCASQGEAIGTATLPKVSEKDKQSLLGLKNMGCYNGQGRNPIIHKPTTIGSFAIPGANNPVGTKGFQMSRPVLPSRHVQMAEIIRPRVPGSMNPFKVVAMPSTACHSSHNGSIHESSVSNDSMNSGSVNTKDLMDDEKESMSNSDQDVPIWATRGRTKLGGNSVGDSIRPRPIRNQPPPWLEQVNVTPELMYRYQIPAGNLSDILQRDLEALKIFGKQSPMVNDQLSMLSNELNVEGNEALSLNLEEGTTSNNSSSGDENSKDCWEPRKTKNPITSHQYNKMVILYEENAPFPPATEIPLSKPEAEV